MTEEVAGAGDFEDVVRIFINSNFDHYAPGNIIPILESQPELASAIRAEGEDHGRNVARYLVRVTADTYNLTPRQAGLLVQMSSGASVAAAQHAATSRTNRKAAVESALAYILAGLEQASNRN